MIKKKSASPLPKLLSKAQVVFNAWIRARDHHLGCISCSASVDHAGHYLSQGHHSALRFAEHNVNGQCVKCNTYLHGNLINYRKGLLRRYGSQVVEMLENYSDRRIAYKWGRDELELIISKYKSNGKNSKGIAACLHPED